MSSSRFSPGQETLTALAWRYGVSETEIWVKDGKSGLTPVELLARDAGLSAEELAARRAIESHQRLLLNGWTSRELQDSGCLDKLNARIAQLTNAIHPVFYRRNWRTSTAQIPDGPDGTYSAKDELVWKALKPSLRLASITLCSPHTWPWVGALLYGERKLIPGSTFTDGGPAVDCCTFRLRAPTVVAQDKRSQQAFLDGLAGKIVFGIGMRSAVNGWHRSRPPDATKPNDPSISERLMQQFMIAKTLLHELMHAIAAISHSSITGTPEPFSEDEAMNEIGFSFEKATWEGYVTSILRSSKITRPIAPLFALASTNFIDYLAQYRSGRIDDTSRRVRLQQPEQFGKGFGVRTWTVPIIYLQDIQQYDYWGAQVSIFGRTALIPIRTIGLRKIRQDEGERSISTLLIGPDYDEWYTAEKGSPDDNPALGSLLNFERWVDQRYIGPNALAVGNALRSGPLKRKREGDCGDGDEDKDAKKQKL